MVTPKKRAPAAGSPDPNALFNDDSDEGEAATDVQDTEPVPMSLGFEAKLVVERGPHAGKILKLGGGVATIGRSSKCELSLKASSGVSRRHCKVQLIGDSYAVIDLESRNGTVVNGDVHPRKILADGDIIEVGDEVIRFVTTKRSVGLPADDVNERETEVRAPTSPKRERPPSKVAPPPLEKSAKQQKPAEQRPAQPRPAEQRPAEQRPAAQRPVEQRASAAKSSPAMKAQKKPAQKASAEINPPITAPPMLEMDDEMPAGRGPPADPTQSYFYDPDVVAQAESDDELPPPLPPVPPDKSRSRSVTRAREPVRDERSARGPAPPPPRRRGGYGAMYVLVFVALVVVVVLAAAAYDTLLGSQNLLALIRGRKPPIVSELEKKTGRSFGAFGTDDAAATNASAADATATNATATNATATNATATNATPTNATNATSGNATNATATNATATNATATNATATNATATNATATTATNATNATSATATDATATNATATNATAATATNATATDATATNANATNGTNATATNANATNATNATATNATATNATATSTTTATTPPKDGALPPGDVRPPPPTPAPPAEVVDVVATSGGRIASVKVKAGATIAKGAVIATLEGSAPKRKLEALREEEKDFEEAAAKGSASAKRDLAGVRAEIAELERHARPTPLVADKDGTVDTVLIKPGDVVKVGQPLVKVR